MHIVFRYDDLAADPPGCRSANPERRQIWEAEQGADKVFEKHGMSYVTGIIPRVIRSNETLSVNGVPFNEDREKLEFVRRGVAAGRIEVAQHGYTHVNHVWETRPSHRQGEFRERGYEHQFHDISEGRKILVQACRFPEVETFIPPWNGWDQNTALALKSAGFQILCARVFDWCPELKGLTLIPKTASLENLEALVARHRLPQEGIMVVIYHPTDIVPSAENTAAPFGVERLNRLLDSLANLPQVQVVTLRQLRDCRPELDLARYHRAVQWRQVDDFLSGVLPEQFRLGHAAGNLYRSQADYARDGALGAAIALAILGVFVLAGAGAGLVVRPWVPAIGHGCLVGFALAIITFCGLAEWHLVHKGYHMTIKRCLPGCMAFGFALVFL